jgi:hypothetical protein
VTPLGAFVRLDVELADSNSVRVELTRQRYAALEPQLGETIFVAPRDVKVFVDQAYAI